MSELAKAAGRSVTARLSDGTEQEFRRISLDDWVTFGDWINIQLERLPGAAVPLEQLFEHAQTLKGMRQLLAMSSGLPEDGLLSRFDSVEQATALVAAIMDQPEPDDEAESGSDPPR